MSNTTFYIDPETQDLAIVDGDLQMISGSETTAQCIRATLLTWLGEWELDTRHGTDYATIFDEQLRDESRIRDIVSAAVYQESEVLHIDQLTVTLTGRELQIALKAQLRSGKTIAVEVATGG